MQGREALLKYILRPAVAQERVTRGPDGLVRIGLKKAFSDGTVAVDLDPLSLLSRLCASVAKKGRRSPWGCRSPPMTRACLLAIFFGPRLGPADRGKRTQEQWGRVWSVAGVYGVPFSVERFESYLRAESARANVAHSIQHARTIRVES